MSLRQRLEEMTEERNRLITKAGEILTGAQAEKVGERSVPMLSAEEMTRFDAMSAEAEKLNGQIEKVERQLAAEAQIAVRKVRERSGGGADDPEIRERLLSEDPKEAAAQELRAYSNWLAFGEGELSEEERQILAPYRFRASARDLRELRTAVGEKRAQSVATTTAGGYAIPDAAMATLVQAMKAYGPMLQAAEIIRTSSGAPLPWPTGDDTGNTGVLLGENTEVDEQDVTLGQATLNAYKFSSKLVRISIELTQDSNFDFVAYVMGLLGQRLGRVANTYATTGTGTSQPQGIVTGATASGVTTASATAVAYGELIQVKHSVDPALRALPGVGWMFNDSTLSALKQLLDLNGRPLWQPGNTGGLAGSNAAQIDGDPYQINQDMAGLTATQKSILYGYLKAYKVRIVGDTRVVRLGERFAEFDQVGLVAFQRLDARLIDPGDHPVKYLTQHA